MGPQGRTKRKVAQASGTHVEIRSVGGQDRLSIEGLRGRHRAAPQGATTERDTVCFSLCIE